MWLGGVGIAKDPVGVFIKGFQITTLLIREPAYGHTTNAVGTLRIDVFPGCVLFGAGGQHFDFVAFG